MAESNSSKEIIIKRNLKSWLEILIVVLLTIIFYQILAFTGFLQFFDEGGMVSFAIIPLLYLAFKYAPLKGCIAGLIFGISIVFVIDSSNSWYANILYYGLGYSIIGIAGAFRHAFRGNQKEALLGIIVTVSLSFLVRCLIAIMLFARTGIPEDQSVWFYWVVSYHLPIALTSMAITMIIVLSLYKKLTVIINKDF
ncbi:MAG: energy-coupled thiamine transporter ThiT [Erysipelotrichales bacterium]|nr:energy-coupled thiamine transporter ThiT [Erysipelotrichales bacterium]